jgi:DNA-binding transcriptional regulator YdaS (Cro superfamily)
MGTKTSDAWKRLTKEALNTPEKRETARLLAGIKKEGMPFTAIAASLGTSPGAIQQMAKGLRAASPDRMEKLKQYLRACRGEVTAADVEKVEATKPSSLAKREAKAAIDATQEFRNLLLKSGMLQEPPTPPKGGSRVRPLLIDVQAGETEAQAEARHALTAVKQKFATAMKQLDLFGATIHAIDAELRGARKAPKHAAQPVQVRKAAKRA